MPYEIVYQQKPDWRNLIPIFSLAYLKHNHDGTQFSSTADSQSIKAICVGNDTKSDGLLFYLPHSKKLIASADNKLDPTVPSGPIFGLQYNGCIGFNLYSSSSEQFRPPVYDTGEEIYFKADGMENYTKGVVIIPSSLNTPLATVQNKNMGDMVQIDPTLVTTLN
eukprot:12208404-Ditylum_brightwellii.AAC.2